MVAEDVRVMTDQIVTSGFTLLGVVVSLFEERWVRTWWRGGARNLKVFLNVVPVTSLIF